MPDVAAPIFHRVVSMAFQLALVITGKADCPLIDPALIDLVISSYHGQGGSDYVSNMLPPTWPYGMAVEVFSARALEEAQAEAAQARDHARQ